MLRRVIFVGSVLICITFILSFFLGEYLFRIALAEKGESTEIRELPIRILKIYLKGNKIHLTIVRTGGGKIDPDDYSKIKMKIDPGSGKPLRQWNLTDVDRNKILIGAGGKIEFDTGIVLEKGETVKAVLSFGKWETYKQEGLSPVSSVAGTKVTEGPSKMMGTAMSRKGKAPSPTPMNLDDSGGIRINLPSRGQSFRPGDRMNVETLFLSDVASGMIELHLKRMSSNVTLSGLMTSFDPTPGRMAYQGVWPLPSRGLPSGSDYYILANHASGAWGISDNFTISAEGEGLIRVLKPQAGEGVTPGFKLRVDYQFTRRVGEGTVNFELYMLDADGRHGRPVLTTTRFHRSQPAGSPEPVHLFEWQLPSDLAVGRCFVLLTHPEAWGRSSNFNIQWEAEAVFPSDYAVVDIFKDRNEVKARIRATGGNMADNIELNVNGAPRRELIRAATNTEIVIGTIPAGYPCGGFYEVTIDPNNRLHEANRTNNSLRKFISFRDPDGYVTAPGGSLEFIPCEPPPGFTEFGSVRIAIHNCSSGPVSTSDIVEVRQTGRDLNRVVPHRVYISECGSLGERRTESEIPPGECGIVWVSIDRDLSNVDSTLTYSFRGALRTWPTLTNPFSVELDFGRWETIIHTDTGRRERRCRYDH